MGFGFGKTEPSAELSADLQLRNEAQRSTPLMDLGFCRIRLITNNPSRLRLKKVRSGGESGTAVNSTIRRRRQLVAAVATYLVTVAIHWQG